MFLIEKTNHLSKCTHLVYVPSKTLAFFVEDTKKAINQELFLFYVDKSLHENTEVFQKLIGVILFMMG